MPEDHWDPTLFHHRSLRGFADATSSFLDHPTWPTLDELEAAWLAGGPWRLLEQGKKSRRARRPPSRDREELYDFRVHHGLIPTRPRSWHDLFNVLVFATFPNAKRTLHDRHHVILSERLPADIERLPPGRTALQDALTVVDEGGVLLCATGATYDQLQRAADSPDPAPYAEAFRAGLVDVWWFGHAHLEQLARARTGTAWTVEPRARPVLLCLPPSSLRAEVDHALDAWLRDPPPARPPFAVPVTALGLDPD